MHVSIIESAMFEKRESSIYILLVVSFHCNTYDQNI